MPNKAAVAPSSGLPHAHEGAFVQMPALSPINVEWLGPLPALDEPARDLALDTSAERHGHNPDYGQHQHRLGSAASSSWPTIRLSRCSVPRQLYLPVRLLGLDALLGCVGAIAGAVKLQDDGVMDHPINRRRGGHGVGEDAFPLREDQV